jgi:hypothetical protein
MLPENKIKYNYDLNLIDIANRFGLNYNTLFRYKMDPESFNKMKLKQIEQQSLPQSSLFGLPIFNNIYLSIQDSANNIFKHINLDCAFITVNQTKNMVKTPISGYRGTIKEILSILDYDVKIEGIFSGDDYNSYDKVDNKLNDNDVFKSLVDICNYAGDVSIQNDFLINKFGINTISIDEVEFSQSHDYSNLIFYTISACDSDLFPISY